MRVTCISVNYNTYQGYQPNSQNPNMPGAPVNLVNATVQFGPIPAQSGQPAGLQAQNFSITFERITDEVVFFPGKVYDLKLDAVED